MVGVQAAFSVWRQSAPRAATSSVGMAAQHHETVRMRKFIVLQWIKIVMIRRWLALTYYLYALRLAALSHFYFNPL